MNDEFRLAEARRVHEATEKERTGLNQAAIESGAKAVNILFILNGAACVALISVLGQVSQGKLLGLAQALPNALTSLAVGAVFAAVASAFSYLTNYSQSATISAFDYSWEHPFIRWNRRAKFWSNAANVFQVVALTAATLSALAFVVAVFTVRAGLVHGATG